MSIFSSLFGAAPATPAPAAQPAGTPGAGQPGNIPPTASADTASSAGTAPNGAVPAGSAAAPDGGAVSPLDQFKDLWQPNANPEAPQPLINVDSKSLAEAAKKTDFSKMIQPEQLQAIAQGGEAGVAAFAAAMNQVAQGVYAQSAFATTKIVEQAVNKAREQFQNDIPAHVKRLNVSENLRSENPALSHPAAAPVLGALEQTLTQKHPNASSSEITQLAKQYLTSLGEAFTAPQTAANAATVEAGKPKDTDWSSYLVNP